MPLDIDWAMKVGRLIKEALTKASVLDLQRHQRINLFLLYFRITVSILGFMEERLWRIFYYWRHYGSQATVRHVRRKLIEFARKQPLEIHSVANATHGHAHAHASVMSLINQRFINSTPLMTCVKEFIDGRRVSIVTDSISQGSLFGGVGTALIFGALLANRLNANLRIITRTESPPAENVHKILALNGIELKKEVQFVFAHIFDNKTHIDFSTNDLFVTTSWWTTASTLASVPASAILYLLQEDERMFYPYGDDHVRCEAVMRNTDIRFLINTHLLFDHLASNGFDHLRTQALWFEPAFPVALYHPRARQKTEKKKFFFYARPHNPRNLFYLGLEVIEKAIVLGVLDLNEWEILLVGKDIPHLMFAGHHIPTRVENLSWNEYLECVGQIDLGLSLMYTPHPSYPPFDLASSGAVVITNRFENKNDLQAYSKSILCADLNCMALVAALKLGVERVTAGLSKDPHAQGTPAQDPSCLSKSWPTAFAQALDHCAEHFHVSH